MLKLVERDKNTSKGRKISEEVSPLQFSTMEANLYK